MSNDEGMTKPQGPALPARFSSFEHSSFVRASSFVLRHFSGKRWPHFGGDDQRQSDGDQEKRKELATGKTGDQARIRFVKIFDRDSKDRVANEKETGQHAVRLSRARAYEPKDREQDNSLENRFVELRWMPRHQNRSQNLFHLRLVAHRRNDRIRRVEQRIDLCTCCDRATGF